MFHPQEMCKRCGKIFRRPLGVAPSLAHQCDAKMPPSLKIYTDEEKKEFERKRKEEEAGQPPKKAQAKKEFRLFKMDRWKGKEAH